MSRWNECWGKHCHVVGRLTLKTSSACCLVAPAGIGAPGCCRAGGACTDAMMGAWEGSLSSCFNPMYGGCPKEKSSPPESNYVRCMSRGFDGGGLSYLAMGTRSSRVAKRKTSFQKDQVRGPSHERGRRVRQNVVVVGGGTQAHPQIRRVEQRCERCLSAAPKGADAAAWGWVVAEPNAGGDKGEGEKREGLKICVKPGDAGASG